jgi:hypothetical protein
MKHGAFHMIPKANDQVCKENSRHPHDPRKLTCRNIHFEFIPQDQTINQAYYVEILKWLREAVRKKRPERWPKDWILHHDNTKIDY